jgi:7,8-dihydropterin-6-yl-methyl-4-(beta-D-ribofuranosyl)aminobenzene 5'-phosphate synthase
MRITALADNEKLAERPDLVKEWGVSLHISHARGSLLFDTGTSGVFADNAGKLGVDVSAIDTAVLSHGHSDHGGGLLRFFDVNARAPVFASEHVRETPLFARIFGVTEPIGLDARVFGEHASRMQLITGNNEVRPWLHLVTAISRRHAPPRFNRILYRREQGKLIPDDFRHELVMAVEEDDGLVVFTGCSHRGILDMVEAVREALPGRHIKGLVGGLHLAGLPPFDLFGERRAEIERLARALYALQVPRIVTGHCTGKRPYRALKSWLGDRIEYMATGASVTL